MIIRFTLDGKVISSQKGYTILKSVSFLNIEIPHLCNYEMDNINNYKNYSRNLNSLEYIKDEKELQCKLCLVKIKRKYDRDFKYAYACNEVVENDMIVVSNDDELITYRKSLLKAIYYSHNAKCSNCNVDYKCSLKNYVDLYRIDKEEKSTNANYDYIDDIKKIVSNFKLPSYIEIDYNKCINCGICKNYYTIPGFNSMIVDICPTKVFSVDRNINKKFCDYDYAKISLDEDPFSNLDAGNDFDNIIPEEVVDNYNIINSFCIGCNDLCEANYYYGKYSIKDIVSAKDKKYGLCDYGRRMDYHSNHILDYPLINGVENDIQNARDFYLDFIEDIERASYLAISSTFYPLEDIKAFNELATSLGIERLEYRKINASTSSNVIKDNYSNINQYSIEELKKELKYIKGSNINYDNYDKFIILGDSLDNNEEIIEFSKKYKRKYILFTPCYSILAYNAHIAFPINGLGEFEGTYIDKYGKRKKMQSFLNKTKFNLRELIKYLYL